jgi:integrase
MAWCRSELGALLVQAGLGSARDHALISLLAMNGLRIGEALGADIDDLDVDRGHRTLRVVRKGGKHAIVPLAPRTARALDLYFGERAVGPIFLGAGGGRMDGYAADRTVKRLAGRAGITKRISSHSVRHSLIIAALDAGVPPRDVQEAAPMPILGRRSATTGPDSRSTGTPRTSWPPSPPAPPADSGPSTGRYRARISSAEAVT